MRNHGFILLGLVGLTLLVSCGGGNGPHITRPPALAITSTAPPSGTVGTSYAGDGFSLTASGGKAPYSWSWNAGTTGSSGIFALPPGLTLSNATISGTPTQANTYNVLVTVTDSQSRAAQKSAAYAITIAPPTSGSPPSIDTIPSPNIGAINLPYRFAFTTSGGLSPFAWSETGALPPGLTLATDGTLAGTPTALGSFPITVMVSDSLGSNATPQNFTIVVVAHGFKTTGSMSVPRGNHTATLLQDGRVLVAGGRRFVSGISGFAYTASAELYDPTAGTFSRTGGMHSARDCHTATLLTNGQVLITGGYDGTIFLAAAEIYDPASGTFAPTGSMGSARCSHTATLLANGKVLIVGGANNTSVLATAELFDPETGSFSSTGSLRAARDQHTATLLTSGKILVTGGDDGAFNPTATAELYDPSSGSFSSTADMAMARADHAATLLTSGKVLISGGANVLTEELFDPASGSFTTTGNMADWRVGHTATLLGDGTVLVAGGVGGSASTALNSAELFDAASGGFSVTGSMSQSRYSHTATLLNDGTVLVTGGVFRRFPIGAGSTAELYQ